jgi:hypothetical protein
VPPPATHPLLPPAAGSIPTNLLLQDATPAAVQAFLEGVAAQPRSAASVHACRASAASVLAQLLPMDLEAPALADRAVALLPCLPWLQSLVRAHPADAQLAEDAWLFMRRVSGVADACKVKLDDALPALLPSLTGGRNFKAAATGGAAAAVGVEIMAGVPEAVVEHGLAALANMVRWHLTHPTDWMTLFGESDLPKFRQVGLNAVAPHALVATQLTHSLCTSCQQRSNLSLHSYGDPEVPNPISSSPGVLISDSALHLHLALLADPVVDQSFAQMEEALQVPSAPSAVHAACEGTCCILVCACVRDRPLQVCRGSR